MSVIKRDTYTMNYPSAIIMFRIPPRSRSSCATQIRYFSAYMKHHILIFFLEHELGALRGVVCLSNYPQPSFLDAVPVAFVDKSLDVIIDPIDQITLGNKSDARDWRSRDKHSPTTCRASVLNACFGACCGAGRTKYRESDLAFFHNSSCTGSGSEVIV